LFSAENKYFSMVTHLQNSTEVVLTRRVRPCSAGVEGILEGSGAKKHFAGWSTARRNSACH
jgi:hypothetical protein